MRSGALFSLVRALGILMVSLSLTGSAWAAPRYKVLHSFGSGQDGQALYGPVAMDSRGSLYGMTAVGGAYNYGTVFNLTPRSKGEWVETILHSFCYGCGDGYDPQGGVLLVFDKLGNIYGTTNDGGAYKWGTVFELTPGSSGWTESVLYSFGGYKGDGGHPYAGVVLDGAGNLYGVTPGGGSSGWGTVYELSPGSGGWNETLLYSFPGKNNDGYEPYADLIWDTSGNLYGTTFSGGSHADGTVFELKHTSGGAWKEHVLYSFNNAKGPGDFPGPLVFDQAGNLYGETGFGGNSCGGQHYSCGTVYKLSRGRDGRWRARVLHYFSEGVDGWGPNGPLARDHAGNLYGVTGDGGDFGCGGCGVVYKLAPRAHGQWKYTVLHTFVGSDGLVPLAGVILDGKGNLYGTTLGGGKYGGGVVFEVTP